jgi:flagellum-specific peptidoglycan hydrolase FlgJ/LysM repeat protein
LFYQKTKIRRSFAAILFSGMFGNPFLLDYLNSMDRVATNLTKKIMKQYSMTLAGLLITGLVFAQKTTDTKTSGNPPAPTTHSTEKNSTVQGASATAEEAGTGATPPAKSDYAEQYKGIAIAEMQRVGIPASIKLAQGILESSSGGSELAQSANNHFGVKCGSNWNGKSYKKKDDEYNDKGEKIESCFRKYSNPEESYYDHSEFLRDPRKYYRYGFLFGLDKQDYRGWAKGLESAGYATEKGYGNKLIDLIEKYKLYQYDDPEIQAMNSGKMNDTRATGKKNKRGRWRNQPDDEDNSIGSTNGKPAPIPPRVGRINDVKVVLANQGETIDDIANVFRLKPERVADYNERRYTPGKPLEAGTRVFISEKRSKWRGRAKHHFVRDNQTMFDISQQYGIKLKDLLKKNGMVPGQEPESGERVRVKGRRKSDELVRLRSNTAPTNNNKPNNNRPSTTTGDELFEIGGDQPDTNPNNKPSTGGTGLPSTPPSSAGTKPQPPSAPTGTKPSTGTGTKPSTSPGSGSLPSDPTPSIPGGAQTTPPDAPVVTPPPINPPPAANQPGYHTVAKGDTLFSLSRKYGITVAKLKSMNGMTNDNIQLGQKLRVQ